ncbi:HsdM family class I SAM-dependent methyltransferase, partial [Streptomyces hoynatensis]|uniref:HsdM family class I SAM-dependent methyltransferase n=1 Tax=Streptomyces hoynatensis TaxID=1141874 RepID=UPI001576E734
MTAAGIARLAGVGRAAVSNWRRRHPDFPQPVGGTDTSPTFSLPDIETWLRNQGKLAEIPLRERLWQLVETHPQGPAEALARTGEHLLDPHPTTDPLTHTATTLAAQTTPHETYEFLLRRHLDTATRHLTLTPPETAHLMAALAGPADTVLDPACGPATLLAAAHGTDGPPTTLYGQETDPQLARLAGLRLALHHTHHTSAVRTGDSLLADAYPDLAADAVLCHPPFNERNWGHDQLTYDPRWEHGLPARTESELAWVQHALARLRPGGTAVLLMPPAAASRRTGRRIRASLLRRGALRAVIALPPGAAPPHSLPLHLWILRKPSATPTPPTTPHLLLVDTATRHRPPTRGTLDWPTLHHTILSTWTTFDTHGHLPTQPGHHRALPVIDLLDDEVDLPPSSSQPPPPSPPPPPHPHRSLPLHLSPPFPPSHHPCFPYHPNST